MESVPCVASGVRQAIRPLAVTSTAQACRGGKGPHPGVLAAGAPASEARDEAIPACVALVGPLAEPNPARAKATAHGASTNHDQVFINL
jgi:hypothetical protein